MSKHLDMAYYVNKESTILKHIVDTFETNASALQNHPSCFEKIVIYATGSSSNAAYAAKVLLAKLTNKNIEIKEPSMALNYDLYLDNKTLYFAISQGGHSTSTIQVVKAIQQQNATVYVITADKQSPLAKIADHILLLNIGEDMPFVTVGESGTIVYLWMIGIYLGKSMQTISKRQALSYIVQIYELIAQLPSCISIVDEWFQKEKDTLCEAKRFLCISYGAGYGSAREFETKFTETVRVPSAGFELEEFMHGPYIGINRNDYIFLFDPAGKLTARMHKLNNFLQLHIDHIYYFTTNSNDDKTINMPIKVDEDFSCLLFNVVAHLTSWYISQIKKVDLSKSSYPDFDEMMKSKL